ncbi:MAG TPA: glycerol kinase GlpK [Acidobacteriaceae bacterium]|nr:glycerol kinase GlpK [Acidobacteriaceae bacterium]
MILAIDQGTTNTKAVLVDRSGQPRARASVRMNVATPQPSWVEQDAEEIWASVVRASREAMQQVPGEKIEGIAISNQRETVVAWDRTTSRPVAPAILWQCRRSEDVCNRMRLDGLESELLARTGLPIDTLFSASKIRWLLDNIPSLRAKAEAGAVCFGTVDSWLIWKLTGGTTHACDASNASRTQLVNLRTREWDPELLAIFTVPREALPQIRDSSGCFGRCTAIRELDDVPIISAMGDSHAAMAGHGSYSLGTVKATYGTGSSLMTLIPSLSPPRREIATTIAWSLKGIPQYALEGNIAMAGSAVAWVGEFLGLNNPADDAIALAASVPDSSGVFFVPAMSGLGAPHWDGAARGTICGLARTSRAAHLAHAAVDSIAFQICDVFEAMSAAADCKLSALHADGGATRNSSLMQFQADILQRPVVRSASEELSALGAAWFGGMALGWWNTVNDLEKLSAQPTQFHPQISAAQAKRLYADWKSAVARTLLHTTGEQGPHV